MTTDEILANLRRVHVRKDVVAAVADALEAAQRRVAELEAERNARQRDLEISQTEVVNLKAEVERLRCDLDYCTLDRDAMGKFVNAESRKVERLREIIDLLASGHVRLLYGWDKEKGRYGFWGTARSHPSDMTRADSSWVGPFETAGEAVEAAEAAEEKG